MSIISTKHEISKVSSMSEHWWNFISCFFGITSSHDDWRDNCGVEIIIEERSCFVEYTACLHMLLVLFVRFTYDAVKMTLFHEK